MLRKKSLLLRKRRRPGTIIKIIAICVIILSIAGLLIFETLLKPTITAFAEAEARWMATKAIHSSILSEISDDIKYSDLMHVEKDSDNRIVFMQPDTIKINKLASNATLEVQESLEQLEKNSFEIPLGHLLGSKLLAHVGPSVKLNLMPVGTIDVSPQDSFEEAGINQTRHRIYLQVESDVKVIIPFVSSQVDVQMQVPVVDGVIVGEVPDTYLNFNLGDYGSQKGFSESFDSKETPEISQ